MAKSKSIVAVYLITYRRPDMLRRALASVLAQTHRGLVVKVVNDDPDDPEVARIVAAAEDPRASLFLPVRKRGGTRNFNLAFMEQDADFVAILEDDNWWEPTFLEEMVRALAAHPQHDLIVGNERIWRETPAGGWVDTGRNIWPIDDVRPHTYSAEAICGSAKLCNSSMLVRVARSSPLLLPETTPLDVTEHFRERLLPETILLHGAVLVNFAVTLATARATQGDLWGLYQQLLIGSVFIAAPPDQRRPLAQRLWARCPATTSPQAVGLVATGVALSEARSLLRTAPLAALARYAISLLRRPSRLFEARRLRRRHQADLEFLVQAPLTQAVAAGLAATRPVDDADRRPLWPPTRGWLEPGAHPPRL